MKMALMMTMTFCFAQAASLNCSQGQCEDSSLLSTKLSTVDNEVEGTRRRKNPDRCIASACEAAVPECVLSGYCCDKAKWCVGNGQACPQPPVVPPVVSGYFLYVGTPGQTCGQVCTSNGGLTCNQSLLQNAMPANASASDWNNAFMKASQIHCSTVTFTPSNGAQPSVSFISPGVTNCNVPLDAASWQSCTVGVNTESRLCACQ
mmetsp:Transcript_6008/g.10802  ORF Transcript_6008/g.10802 Transcript_6008/m.10802 type:complete len:205 (-) Transcript_6008:160-774(-)